MIEFDFDKCIKCGQCIKDCPAKVIVAGENGRPVVQAERKDQCINCQHCLAICPVGAVKCNGVSADVCGKPGELPEPEKMMNLLRQRRSVRRFLPEAIDADLLAKLKSVLPWSPTGCNDRGLAFNIVDNPNDMAFYRETTSKMLKFMVKIGIMRLVYPSYKRFLGEIMTGKDVIFRDAPAMIVVSVSKKNHCKEADPWIALTYFDTLLQSFGLGSCWCGFGNYAFRFNRTLRKRLNLPPEHKIGAVLLFGKPAVQYPRVTCPSPYPVICGAVDGCFS